MKKKLSSDMKAMDTIERLVIEYGASDVLGVVQDCLIMQAQTAGDGLTPEEEVEVEADIQKFWDGCYAIRTALKRLKELDL